jgi:hypothetical protein
MRGSSLPFKSLLGEIMSELFLVEQIDAHRLLCASELSDETISDQIDGASSSASGIYLYVVDERALVGGITVLARVTSADAAYELFDLFANQHRGTRSNDSVQRLILKRYRRRKVA